MSLTGRLWMFFLLGAAAVVGEPIYTIIDLGMVGVSANGLNNIGDVAGALQSSSCAGLSFCGYIRYNNGQTTILGALPGGTNSTATAINDVEQVVGASGTMPFLYSNGQMTSLGLLPGADHGVAVAINNAGQAVGYSMDSTGSYAILWSNGQMTSFGMPGDLTEAMDINDSGEVVGGSAFRGAFLFSNGQITWLGTTIALVAINNGGQAVGGGRPSNTAQAVLYSNGQMTSLGTLPGDTTSLARNINDEGQVVGVSQLLNNQNNPERAFLYSSGTMYGLNDLVVDGYGWSLETAWDINDSGQIIGGGTLNNQPHAFLLTPVQSAVPEPASMILCTTAFVVSLAFCVAARCRRQHDRPLKTGHSENERPEAASR
jgi:probable HAF family extracellular repeat protein